MQLCIDAADDHPGLALAIDGVAEATLTWETNRNHSVELLPNIERLLTEAGRTKSDIAAVFVDLGPGGYAALRVGVSIAKALAHGLGVPIVGIGRLELDAWGAARDTGLSAGRLVALHRSGRGELAVAAFAFTEGVWAEANAPSVIRAKDIRDIVKPEDVVTGDVDADLAEMIDGIGATVASPSQHRVVALAELGNRRIVTSRVDEAGSLVPMYLRAPAIGPQPV
jgi:tRNA threonylcarbamoyladenosine biosynthesis protein TsaB